MFDITFQRVLRLALNHFDAASAHRQGGVPKNSKKTHIFWIKHKKEAIIDITCE